MCDYAEAYQQKDQKARKEHTCGECDNPIPIGENYSYSSGIFEGKPFSKKRCLSCVKLLNHLDSIADCVDEPIVEFLINSDLITRQDDEEDYQPCVPWLRWEQSRWTLLEESVSLAA